MKWCSKKSTHFILPVLLHFLLLKQLASQQQKTVSFLENFVTMAEENAFRGWIPCSPVLILGGDDQSRRHITTNCWKKKKKKDSTMEKNAAILLQLVRACVRISCMLHGTAESYFLLSPTPLPPFKCYNRHCIISSKGHPSGRKTRWPLFLGFSQRCALRFSWPAW